MQCDALGQALACKSCRSHDSQRATQATKIDMFGRTLDWPNSLMGKCMVVVASSSGGRHAICDTDGDLRPSVHT